MSAKESLSADPIVNMAFEMIGVFGVVLVLLGMAIVIDQGPPRCSNGMIAFPTRLGPLCPKVDTEK